MATILLLLACGVTGLCIGMLALLGNSSGPNAAGGAIGLFFLAFFRLILLAAGLLALPGRTTPALIVIVGAILVEAAGTGLVFIGLDAHGGGPAGLLAVATGLLIPVLIALAGIWMAQGWPGGENAMLATMAFALIAGVGSAAYATSANATYETEQKQRRAAEDAQGADLRRQLEALPSDATISDLLPFTDPRVEWSIASAGAARIAAVADAGPQLVALLAAQGDDRDRAINALANQPDLIQTGQVESCLRSLERRAEEFNRDLDAGRQPDFWLMHSLMILAREVPGGAQREPVRRLARRANEDRYYRTTNLQASASAVLLDRH